MEINRSIDTNPSLPRKAGRAPAPRALCRCTRAPNNKSGESYGALHPPRVRQADRGGGGGGGGGYGSIPGVGAEVTGSPCSE